MTYPQNQDPNQQPPYSQQYPQGHPAWTALPPPQPQDQQQPPKKSNVATVITVIVMLALCLGCFGFIATAFTGEGETATAPAETTTAPADTATEAEPVGYLIGASVTALCPEYTDQLNDFQDKYSN